LASGPSVLLAQPVSNPFCHLESLLTPRVYEFTMRKAAPRKDYIAMLDKRLKRMGERIVKIIPKEELSEALSTGRASVKPTAIVSAGTATGGRTGGVRRKQRTRHFKMRLRIGRIW